MKTYTKSIIVAAGLLAALPAAFGAPGDPVTQVRGQVTAVDATAKTVTLTMRNQTTSVLHVSAATKYYTDATGAVTDIKVGDTVRVQGQTAGTTITARRISVLPAEEAAMAAMPAPAAGGGGGGRRGGTQGVVASVTPTFTITLADKSVDTVTTDAATVTTVKPGMMTDVKAQGNVSALTTGTGDTAMATEVHVMAAGGFGGGRGGAGGAGANGAGGGAGAAGGGVAGGGRRRRGAGAPGAGAPGAGAPGAGAPGAAPMPAGQ